SSRTCSPSLPSRARACADCRSPTAEEQAMTRRQVRNAMRRLRTEHEEADEETAEINLVPYMDIVTNIIIFLLASVITQVPLGNINISSPTFGAGAADTNQEKDKQPLNLTVTVAANGFIIAGSGGVTEPIKK